jgi:hypothetical protein
MPQGGDQMRVFVGRVVGGDPSVHDREHLEVRWFPLDALPRRLFKLSREHVEDALAYAALPIDREQRLYGLDAVWLACFCALRWVRDLIRRWRGSKSR